MITQVKKDQLYFQLKEHMENLMQPCHTSAYDTAVGLDVLVREIFEKPSNSDYGHITLLINYIIKTAEHAKWNGNNYIQYLKDH